MYQDVRKYQYLMEHELYMFIEYLLLHQKICLSEVPPPFRILSKNIYLHAFRVDRNVSKEQYLEDLEILKKDIQNAKQEDQPYMRQLYEKEMAFCETYVDISEASGD